MTRHALAAIAASVALLGATTTATTRAIAGDTTSAVAQALFEEGHAALEKKDYATACPKLEESQRLEPRNGTLLNLATCHLGAGKTATAWVEFKEGLAQAVREGRAANERYAREQLTLIEPKLSRLTIQATDAPAELEVTIDGARLGAGGLGAALPVDPGAHTIVAHQPGHVDWSTKIEVPAGPWSKTIDVPPLSTSSTSDVAATSGTRLTPWVWTLGAVAVASIGVGTYFGLHALSKNREAEAKCPNTVCVDDGLELDRQAHGAATISTIAFGIGAAAAIGAIVVYATGDTTKASARVGITPGGLSLSGAF